MFPEHLSCKLPSDVTVVGPSGTSTVLTQGTLVDSYFAHADWVNNGQNTPKQFASDMTFDQPVLGIIKDSTALMTTNPTLGAPGTTYSTASDQGLERYDDSASFSNNGQTVNLKLTVWNSADDVCIITKASPSITHNDSIEVIGAPCSVVEHTLESDHSIRIFPERLDYVLPADVTMNGKLLVAGTKVNVYYVHADRVGDQQGVMKTLTGSVTFDTLVLGMLTKSADLMSTDSTLGATQDASVHTTYSTRADQGLESDDKVTVSSDQTRVALSFNVWNAIDQVRIITAAP